MSELHKRLAHLVNYSSQLIFVSGDSIADQQRTLSDFLSSQQDNTEISFFTASKQKQASDYRGAICRQLGGHEVGSFIRPLQQLLSNSVNGLTSENGPYLVCITQADTLDTSFLQELWDWVMHSQQADPGIHLNIILFGESSWAKQSQEWLPIQNSHKPVLLSSELVNPVGFDVHALEALMADKSSWFSTSNKPLVTNKWFIGSVLSAFLVVFVSLMAWQYPAQVSSLLAGHSGQQNQTNTSIDPLIFEQSVSADNTREPIVDNDVSDLKHSNAEYPPLLEVVEPDEAQSITDELLVTSWANSKTILNEGTNTEIIENNDKKTSENPKTEELQTNDASLGAAPANSTSSTSLIATNPDAIKITNKQPTQIAGDFQVPDIISVEELDAQLGSTQSTNPPLVTNISPTNERQQRLPLSTTNIDYQFDENTLLSLPIDSVVLQLSGIQNPVVLENYLNNNNLKATTWVYETQRYGGPWYVVLYRQSFESIDVALDKLSSLPIDVSQAQPFAKSINQIQQEISRR